jgi:hypothetical protein
MRFAIYAGSLNGSITALGYWWSLASKLSVPPRQDEVDEEAQAFRPVSEIGVVDRHTYSSTVCADVILMILCCFLLLVAARFLVL